MEIYISALKRGVTIFPAQGYSYGPFCERFGTVVGDRGQCLAPTIRRKSHISDVVTSKEAIVIIGAGVSGITTVQEAASGARRSPLIEKNPSAGSHIAQENGGQAILVSRELDRSAPVSAH